MKIYKIIEKTEEEVQKILCDVCKTEIDPVHLKNDEYLHIEKRWGYHSPWDGEIHEFDICPCCYEKFLKQIKKKNKSK